MRFNHRRMCRVKNMLAMGIASIFLTLHKRLWFNVQANLCMLFYRMFLLSLEIQSLATILTQNKYALEIGK